MHVFESLDVWIDPVSRPGPEAMAVDEWLMETRASPVLRVYPWSGNWGTLGYFGRIAEARAAFPGLPWVRRWTGGGTVDHRADWTYTIFAPKDTVLARMKGAESYRAIHAALAVALAAEGIPARLSDGSDQTGAAACFANPVGHDIVDASGRKLAGAGQRRGGRGLLHQGSVALPCDAATSTARACSLARALCGSPAECLIEVPENRISALVRARYGRPEWTERR